MNLIHICNVLRERVIPTRQTLARQTLCAKVLPAFQNFVAWPSEGGYIAYDTYDGVYMCVTKDPWKSTYVASAMCLECVEEHKSQGNCITNRFGC